MKDKTLGFIGLGLIGGSIARAIKASSPNVQIYAYMRTRSKLEQAKADGVVDVIMDGIGEQLSECDIIFLCTPVEYIEDYLGKIKPYLREGQIITDIGSTKTEIHEAVHAQGLDHLYVGGHPMAGSEQSGYENSSDYLLENAYYIITPTPESTQDMVDAMVEVAEEIRALPLVLDYHKHDMAVAAISHLPHLIASSLVNLVHDSDDESKLMKKLAAGGFKDITRIASSSPVMWEQICMTNTANISILLERYIASLNDILANLENHTEGYVNDLFEKSREYRNSFSDRKKGAMANDYSFSVDVKDEPGAISIVSSILAGAGISIKNVGINHNREHGEGALAVSFYDEKSMKDAWTRLISFNFKLSR